VFAADDLVRVVWPWTEQRHLVVQENAGARHYDAGVIVVGVGDAGGISRDIQGAETSGLRGFAGGFPRGCADWYEGGIAEPGAPSLEHMQHGARQGFMGFHLALR
jgi:hypothetical protein